MVGQLGSQARQQPERPTRSRPHEAFDIPIPRDGGLQGLLAEAERPDRRFDVVICGGIDRISRRTYYGALVEHRLEQAGVQLLAADEPFSLDPVRGRARTATQVLTSTTMRSWPTIGANTI
jgi:hypothetical protein